jgi:hypothetical protein
MHSIFSPLLQLIYLNTADFRNYKFKGYEIWLRIYANYDTLQGSLLIEDRGDHKPEPFHRTSCLIDFCIR